MSDELSTDDLRSAALRGLSWTVIARPIVEVTLLATMVVLARLISPAEFGRYAVALVVGELMFVPAQAVGTALVQRPHTGSDYLETGEALSILLGLAIVLITLLAASLVVGPVFGERTAFLVRLSTIGCVINSTNMVPAAVLQRRLAFRRLSVVQVATTVVRAAASISLAIAWRNATALVVGGLIGAVAGTILLWSWAPPKFPRLHRAPTKDLASYGIPAGFAALGWVGFRNCDYAIVGARLGPVQAGYYFRSYTLGVEYQKKVSQVMSSIGFPLLARAKTDGEKDALRGRMVRLLTLVLFPALVLLGIVAPVLIPWLFGAEWAPSVVPTQILVFGGAVVLVIDAVGAGIMAAGRARAMVGYGWGHFIVYAAAVFVIAPLGITAVAIAATTVHTIFLFVAYVMLLRRPDVPMLQDAFHAIRALWDDIEPATVSCVALAIVAVPTGIGLSAAGVAAVPHLVLVSLVGLAGFLGALRVLYPASLLSLRNLIAHVLPRLPIARAARRSLAAETGSAA